MYKLPAPNQLNLMTGNIADNWDKFKSNICVHICALGVDVKKEPRRAIAIMMSVGGQDLWDAFDTLKFEEGEDKDWEKVIEKLEESCIPKRNVVQERFEFNCMCQKKGESVLSYITDLRIKATKCEFGEQKDSLIRDRLVIGLRDRSLTVEMIVDPDLTLDAAVEICRRAEATKMMMRHINRR